MFMSFVVRKTNEVDMRRVLQELDQLQQLLSDRDVDRVVDLVIIGLLDNDLTKIAFLPNKSQVSNAWQFGLVSVNRSSLNLTESNSLSLPNFPMQDYMLLLAVPLPALYVPPLQHLLVAILDKPLQPPHAPLSSPSIFDMLKDLPTTDINVEQMDVSMEPISTIVVVVDGGNYSPLMDFQERTTKVDVVVYETYVKDNDELSRGAS
jgi:hypothetical protein